MNAMFSRRQKVGCRAVYSHMDTGKTGNRGGRRKSDYVGFRAPAEIQEMLQRAVKSSGAEVTELLMRCVQRALADVVIDILRERQQAHQEFQNYMMEQTASKIRAKPGK